MSVHKISKRFISSLKPKSSVYEIRDSKIVGFLVRVLPTGKISFYYEYARGKKKHLGNLSNIDVDAARTQALSMSNKAFSENNFAKNSITFGSFFEDQYCQWASLHIRSFAKKQKDIIRYFEFLFKLKFEEITPAVIERWRVSEINRGVKSATVKRNETMLRAIISKALDWAVIEKHCLSGLKRIQGEDNEVIRYLSDEEFKSLLDVLGKRDSTMKAKRLSANAWRAKRGYKTMPEYSGEYADRLTPAVILTLSTGMRLGEMIKLKWDAVDLDRKFLTIKASTSKSKKTLHLPLNEACVAVLIKWKVQNDSEYVIPSPVTNGQSSSEGLKKAWGNVLVAANIKNFRWHDLRHTFASRLVMSGVDLNTVRELMGHSNMKMTMRYAHLSPEYKTKSVAVIESWFAV